MRLLILGGTVFLSAEIARQAVAAGDEVWCLTRGTSGPAPAGVHWVPADRDAGPSVYGDLTGEWDAVIDVSRSAPQARSALTALSERAAHWTYVSSCSVYARHDEPGADEGAELLPPFDGPGTPETYGGSKVASELAARSLVGDRLLVLRPGLIAGPGDPYGRLGYWPARFARDGHDDVLVPEVPWLRTQAISVIDLARFGLRAVRDQLLGTYNTVSRSLPLAEVIDAAQRVARHDGRQVAVAHQWLLDRGVEEWMGPESLPLWLPWDFRGFADRSVEAAYAAGLVTRSMETLLAEDLGYEREQGLLRERRAGLSPAYEAELLRAWREH